MLDRLGLTGRRSLILFISIALLVVITPTGKEASNPLVLGMYRSLLLVVIAVYAWSMRETLPRICPKFLLALGAVVAVMFISVIARPGSHFEGLYAFYEKALFIGAFLALAHASPSMPIPWKRTLLGAVALIQIAYVAGALISRDRPLIGPFVNPNYFASFLLPGLAICVAAVVSVETSVKLRLAGVGASAFLYYGIVKTTSRGATLAGLALLALAGFRAARRYGVSWVRLVGASALVAAITIAANPALISKFLDRGEHDPHNYQRVQIWKGTLAMIAEHPIAGIGLRQYYYAAKRFTPAVEGTIARYRRWPNIAHSEYLHHIAEIGIPAALILFTLGGYLFLLAWRRAQSRSADTALFQEAALLTATGLAAHALVDNNWTVPVIAAGMVVISQADLLPYRAGMKTPAWTFSPVRHAALAMFLFAFWIEAAVSPAVGLHFNEMGHQAFEARDFRRAELMHRLGLAIIPNHPVLLDNLGTLYYEEFMKTRKPGYLDRAEELFSESMAQNSHYDVPASHLETALLQRFTGNAEHDRSIHARIVEIDRHVLETNPFNPLVRKNLAEALFNLGRRKEAYEEILKALEFEPNYVSAYLQLADWYKEEGRLDESEAYRKRATDVVALYQNTQSTEPFENVLLGRQAANSVKQ